MKQENWPIPDSKDESFIKKLILNLPANLDEITHPYHSMDENGCILEVNSACLKILGYSREEVIGEYFGNFLTTENLYNFKKFLQLREKPDFIKNLDISIKTRDEKYKNVQLEGVWDNNGFIKQIHCIFREITPLRQMEEDLQESEQHIEDIFNHLPDATFAINNEGVVIAWNKAMEKMTGLTSPKMIGRGDYEYALPFYGERRPILVDLINGDMEEIKKLEYTQIKKEGLILTAETVVEKLTGKDYLWGKASPLYDGKGNIVGAIESIRDITENKKIIEKLHQSEGRFKAVAESAVDGLLTTDKQGIIRHFNKSFLKMFGYQEEEVKKQPVTLLIPENLRNKFQERFQKFQNTGRHDLSGKTFQSTGLRKDGTEFPFEMSLATWQSEGENYNTSIIRDVTERNQAENEVKKANIYNRSIIETSLDIMITIGIDGRIIDVNQSTLDLSGYSRDELIGSDFKKYFNNTQKTEMGFRIVLKEGSVQDFFLEIKHKNGKIIPFLLNASVYRDESGNVMGIFAAARNITNIKKAEKELLESQNKLKIAMDLAKLVYWEYDVEKDQFTFDDQFYSLYGTTTDEVGGVTMSSLEYSKRFIPQEWSNVVAVEIKKALLTSDPNYKGYAEHPIIRADGERRFILVRFGVVKDENGKTIKTYGANQDITERIAAIQKIKDSEKKYYSLYSVMNEGMALNKLVYDKQGKPVNYIITDVNPAYEEMLGINREDVVGKTATEVYKMEEDPNLDKYVRVAQSGGSEVFELYSDLLCKHFQVSILSPERGKFATVFEDITLRKKAEEEIKTSLQQKEILLQEIHHRVKNNLQIISSLLNLQEGYVKDEEAVAVLRESRNRVLSMAMIHEMLYDSLDLSTINFSHYIDNLVYDLFNTYGVKASLLNLKLDVDEIFLNIDTAVPCGLMISEMVSNALKYAFPDGQRGNISIEFHQNDDEVLELVIADDGVGLPNDVDLETTESLGLRLVSSLAHQLDGEIELDRSQGTKFIIKFKELKYRKRV